MSDSDRHPLGQHTFIPPSGAFKVSILEKTCPTLGKPFEVDVSSETVIRRSAVVPPLSPFPGITSNKEISDFMRERDAKNHPEVPTRKSPIDTAIEVQLKRPVMPTSQAQSARVKLLAIKNRINDPQNSKSTEKAGAESHAPSPEELKLGVSVERLVFLERVEKIMASEARIKEIEAENKTLVGMVTRLQKEIEELKAKVGQKL